MHINELYHYFLFIFLILHQIKTWSKNYFPRENGLEGSEEVPASLACLRNSSKDKMSYAIYFKYVTKDQLPWKLFERQNN